MFLIMYIVVAEYTTETVINSIKRKTSTILRTYSNNHYS